MTHQQIAQLMNRANTTLAHGLQIIMAKQEIVRQTPLNPWRTLWWRLMPGTTIRVAWPTGWTEPVPAAGGGFIQMESADPNDHFRPWLEQNVGRQGWDWDWRLGEITGAQGSANGPTYLTGDYLDIKFRRGREKYATLFIMRQK